ncbi:MAG TPA: polysaccharide deacetylase family protein [Candidatus Eisenbacteria bacterium]|nr:polysaccharide deacetylase family protein [Candidatus Eisenbacteria bacterium]
MRPTFRRLARPLIERRRRGGLVLLYHRAANVSPDPWRLAVTPNHLHEHLDILARYTRTTTARKLRASMDRGRIQSGTVLVTFDDGYADLATEVRPLLDRADVPASVFIVSSAIDMNREFWWDALERSLLGTEPLPDRLSLRLGEALREWDVASVSRDQLHLEVYVAVRSERPIIRDALADQVLAWAGLSTESRPSHRTLRATELEQLAVDDLVEIGAHTHGHAWLAGLAADDQRAEIEGGRAELEARIGRPIDTFAYPHGLSGDIAPDTTEIVREAGFGSAFMSVPGRVHPASDAHALPRLFVEDQDGESFSELLWQAAGIRAG